jgi:hypothetical protein
MNKIEKLSKIFLKYSEEHMLDSFDDESFEKLKKKIRLINASFTYNPEDKNLSAEEVFEDFPDQIKDIICNKGFTAIEALNTLKQIISLYESLEYNKNKDKKPNRFVYN